jgi:hypothetical protein
MLPLLLVDDSHSLCGIIRSDRYYYVLVLAGAEYHRLVVGLLFQISQNSRTELMKEIMHHCDPGWRQLVGHPSVH